METGVCRHCGATITHANGETIAAFGYDVQPCWRYASGGTGQAWCSRTGGDGPPHAPAYIPDLNDHRAVEDWLWT